jgi:hypothetical protein
MKELVTTFWPLITTGGGRFVAQMPEERSAVDCKVNSEEFVGHARTRLCGIAVMVSVGGTKG